VRSVEERRRTRRRRVGRRSLPELGNEVEVGAGNDRLLAVQEGEPFIKYNFNFFILKIITITFHFY